MERKNKIPITRLNRFYDETDFQLELDMAKELIEEDGNFTVVLYRIDRVKSNADDIYGESETNEIRFLEPVELVVLPNLQEAENKTYVEGKMRYQEHGNFIFTILTQQLKEKNVDISYGDIVAYAENENSVKYFEVANDDRIASDNKHTMYGYKGYYRTITCVTVDRNQFNGI